MNNVTHDFGWALDRMREKRKVSIKSWNPDVFLQIQKPDENSKMSHPYIYVTSRFGTVPWVATQVELLSLDWTYN
jgi:hypothetical protein